MNMTRKVCRLLCLLVIIMITRITASATTLPNCAGTVTVDANIEGGILVPDGQTSQWTSNTLTDSALQGPNINNKV